MRIFSRRMGVAAAITLLSTSLISTTQAGIIPWAYDVIFGPNYPTYATYGGPAYMVGPTAGYHTSSYGPVGYAPSGYAQASGYAQPRGCRPCGIAAPVIAWAPCQMSPCGVSGCSTGTCSTGSCSSGGCSTVARRTDLSSGPCTTGTVNWQSKKSGAGSTARDSKTEPPRPMAESTFATDSAVESTTVKRPDTSSDSAIESTTTTLDTTRTTTVEATGRPAISDTTDPGEFAPPVAGTEPEAVAAPVIDPGLSAPLRSAPGTTSAEDDPFKQPVIRDNTNDAEAAPAAVEPGFEALPSTLGDQSSWNYTAPIERVTLRATHRNARIARSTIRVDVDYVIASESPTRLVSR